MYPQRSLLRASQRYGQQLRSQPVRSKFQRRFASSQGSHGAEDNAFNRERAAVKQHAAESSGQFLTSWSHELLFRCTRLTATYRSLAETFHLVPNSIAGFELKVANGVPVSPSPAYALPQSMPIIYGPNIGSTGRTSHHWRNDRNIPTKTFGPRASLGGMEIRYVHCNILRNQFEN